MGLQELDRNVPCFKKPPRHEASFKQLSRSQPGRKGEERSKIVIVMNRRKVLEFSKSQALTSASRNSDGSVTVICIFDKASFKKHWNQCWITMRTRVPVFEQDMITASRFSVSRDRFHVTIFSDSTETLLKDIEINLQWFEQTAPVPRYTQELSMPPADVTLDCNFPDVPITTRSSPICHQELSLNKSQVTYLIGKNGSRIETIRQLSQATIKVLPINKRLTSRELNHPNIVSQLISITGDWHQVALAFSYIETNLQLHKLAPRRISLYP